MDDHKDSFSKTNQDVINRATSIEEVIRLLGERGCRDLTSSIDPTACDEFPCAGGGFCEVFKGHLFDSNSGSIAIKSLRVYSNPRRSGESAGSKILKQAAREMYHWSKLQHRNVLPLMGLAIFRDRISMVSQWMDNGSLVSFLEDHPEANRMRLCQEVCEGLCYIHENEMVHGDLKAANVMVSSDGVALIADFGNCRLRELTLKFSNSTQRAISLRWAAPELMLRDDTTSTSKKADVYAYGMTALEVLSGRLPFDEYEDHRIMYLVTTGRRYPSRLNIDLDDDMWSILTECWSWSPAERPDITAIKARLHAVYPQCQAQQQGSGSGSTHASGAQDNFPGPGPEQADSVEDRAVRLSGLGNSHMRHYEHSGELTDLNQAINFHADADRLTPDHHVEKPSRLNSLGNSYRCRYERLGQGSDLERAIECQTEAVWLVPDGHPEKPSCLNSLGNSLLFRFEHLGELADINRAIEYHNSAVLAIPEGNTSTGNLLSDLGTSYLCRFKHSGDVSDIDKAIDFHTQALGKTPYGHVSRPGRLSNLGSTYLCRFERTKDVADINRAIDFHNQVVVLTPGHADRPVWLNNLGESYMLRFQQLGDLSDVEIAHSTFQQVAQSATGHPRARFTSARRWAKSSIILGISPHEAYQRIMELMPQLVWLGIPVRDRYSWLIEIGDVAMEAASCAISFQAYYRALQWLEEGRSIIWNQMLQLRTPFEELSVVNPALAKRLKDVGSELERAGSRAITMSLSTWDMQSMEQRTQYHHGLALEWEQLLKRARDIPEFQDLMRPRKAKELMCAATDGPIAVINVHESRCDALIILPHCEDIVHVPLENFSPEKALKARAKLHSFINHGVGRARGFKLLKPPGESDTLKAVLVALWHDVVQPVLSSLGITHQLPLDNIPHITWCTTGVLSFLPLHAAGCYDGMQPNACDLVVSSYTPTLSALLSSVPSTSSSDSGLLAVGQENTPGLPILPATVSELAAIRNRVVGYRYLQLDGRNATVEAVLTAMNDYSWVHLACHATQNKNDPDQSAFFLQDGQLTLRMIAKKALKNKGLAFLPACETAAGDEKLPDEALHLAAGMLMAGYPSVIATMWAIYDVDGPEIGGDVYAELLKDGKMDCKGAARATHKAVAQLRQKVGDDSFGRWVPFIHIGV